MRSAVAGNLHSSDPTPGDEAKNSTPTAAVVPSDLVDGEVVPPSPRHFFGKAISELPLRAAIVPNCANTLRDALRGVWSALLPRYAK